MTKSRQTGCLDALTPEIDEHVRENALLNAKISRCPPKAYSMKTIISIFAVHCFVLLAGGCAGPTTFGGEESHKVRLQTSPGGGYEVFVVPYDEWPASAPESLLNDPTKLENYRLGISPLEIKLPPYMQVLVAKNKRDAAPRFRCKYFTPGMESTPTIDFSASQ